jgi:hypothetical protein
VIRDIHGLREYAQSVAKAVYTRGFEVSPFVDLEFDGLRRAAFKVAGRLEGRIDGLPTEMIVEERWWPVDGTRWERAEYTYDLIDRPTGRRRAYHLHDADRLRALLGVAAHEHCEDTLGSPRCDHYEGLELPDAYRGIDLLVAAWVDLASPRCDTKICLGRR